MPSTNFFTVLIKNYDSLVRQYAMASVQLKFLGFTINFTFICLQTTEYFHISGRLRICNTDWIIYCRGAITILFVPVDFNSLEVHVDCFILDWLIDWFIHSFIDYNSGQVPVCPVYLTSVHIHVRLLLTVSCVIRHPWICGIGFEQLF
jgi:hypothetical protein